MAVAALLPEETTYQEKLLLKGCMSNSHTLSGKASFIYVQHDRGAGPKSRERIRREKLQQKETTVM